MIIGQLFFSNFMFRFPSNYPPPRKRGRTSVSVEEQADIRRKFREIAPGTMKFLIAHAQDILKTEENQIVEKYIKNVYKSHILGIAGIDDELPEYIIQIGKNIASLYNRLNITSPFAYPYLRYLSTSVPSTKFEDFTGISRLTIWRANNDNDDSILDVSTNINRSGPAKYSEEDKHRVITCIMNICPVPSGSKYPKHYQYMSNKDLYLRYLAACESDPNLTVMSKGTFFLLHDLVNIRAVSFDFTTSCPFCDVSQCPLLVDEDYDEDGDEVDQTTPKKTKEEHLHLKTVQFEKFQEIREFLGPYEVLIVMDFTSAAIPHAKSQYLYANDLIFTIYIHGGHHDWINYMSTSDNKQMYPYVESSLLDLISTYLPHNIQRLYVFSDGGPHHFKIWKTINLFHYLSKMYEIPIEYHFFESYHGSSLCDAHAGHVKKAIRYLIRDGTKITTLEELMPKLIKLDLKNATFEKMIPLNESLIEELKKVPGLKKLYKFEYDGKCIKMYSTSADTVPCKVIKF
jgi:hypothetical protein